MKTEEANDLLSNKEYNKIEILRHPNIILAVKIIKQLEILKRDYDQLKFKETNATVIKNLKKLYQLIGQEWDGFCLSSPKIILNIDDASGSSIFTSFQNNPVFKMLT